MILSSKGRLTRRNHGLCKCCETVAQYVSSHLDPMATLHGDSDVSYDDLDEIAKQMGCTPEQRDALIEYAEYWCDIQPAKAKGE